MSQEQNIPPILPVPVGPVLAPVPRSCDQQGLSFLIYADGSCLGNPGSGGAGFTILCRETAEVMGRAYGFRHVTNIRAEIFALVLAIESVPDGATVEAYTDCQWLVSKFGQLSQLAANGWIAESHKGRKPVKHRDLLNRLLVLSRRRSVSVQWVRGHSGVEFNEMADCFANDAAQWAASSAVVQTGRDGPHLCPNILPLPLTASFVPRESYPDGMAGELEPPTQGDINRLAYLENHTRRVRPRVPSWVSNGYSEGRTKWDNLRSRARTVKIVGLHEGNRFDFLYRFWAVADKVERAILRDEISTEVIEFCWRLFNYATDFRMLNAAWDHSASKGGVAPGIDGRTFESYGKQEKVATLQRLTDELRSGKYQPSPLRRAMIPKVGKPGMRPLDIPIIRDRVVETAMNWVLTPFFEPLMMDTSFGFRPGKSIAEGLALVKWYAEHDGLWTMTAMDLKTAFTSVPKERLIDLTDRYIPNKRLANLIRLIIQRPLPQGEGIRKGIGLPQGSPLSPLLLNLYVSEHLDTKWATEQATPILRYADDLLLLNQTPGQVVGAMEHLERRLEPHGLTLKEEFQTADLTQGGSINTWGFGLSQEASKLCIQAPHHKLIGDLRHIAEDGNAEMVADYVAGWLNAAGPAYPGFGPTHLQKRYQFIDRMAEAARITNADLQLPTDEMHRIWEEAGRRWNRIQQKVEAKMLQRLSHPPSASPPGTLLRSWAESVRRIRRAGHNVGHAEESGPGRGFACARGSS